MSPQRNDQLICSVCRKEMSEDGELILHEESSTNLPPNETTTETARSLETPVAELVQITSDDKQNKAESMASTLQTLQSAEKETSANESAGSVETPVAELVQITSVETPVAELVQITSVDKQNSAESMTSTLQTSQSAEKEISANESHHKQSSVLPVFIPPLWKPEVKYISKYIALYQALYKEAVAATLVTIKSTLDLMQPSYRALNFATARNSERIVLSNKIQELNGALEAKSKSGMCVKRICREYRKTLVAVETIMTKERQALHHLKKAVIDQKAAFSAMIKADNRKHEAFNTAFMNFFKMEKVIDTERFKSFSINNK